jgi:predicted transcriptional regulator
MDKKAGQIDVSARILGILDYFEINQTELAADLEITPGYVSSILAGTKTPSSKLIHKIKKKYAVLDLWWETGEGEVSEIDPRDVNSELGQAKMQRDFVEKYISTEIMTVVDSIQSEFDDSKPKARYAAISLLNKYIKTGLKKDVQDFLGEEEEN